MIDRLLKVQPTMSLSVAPLYWPCTQNTGIAIQRVQELFEGYLKEEESYIAVETTFFAGGFEISSPVSKLRIIKN
ncbi:MAG: hypothetical protein FWF59_14810 [Turicibacter sp.]|nr:hypothetical protein [Turicibacter sp.]